MKFRWLSLACMFVASAVFSWTQVPAAVAQQAKASGASSASSDEDDSEEVLTVAVAPLDKLLPNIVHVMRLVGAGAQSGLVNQAVNGYTNGLDRTRPIGAFVSLNDINQPVSIAALPVSDLEAFLSGLELFGEPEDLGDGLYSMSFGAVSVFGQLEGEWLYVSSSEEALEEIPEGATARLDAMVAKNDITFEVNIQNIPEQLVDLLKDQMRTGFEQAMEAQSGDMNESELEASRASGEQMIKNFEEIIESTETFVIGLAIRPKDKAVTIDAGSKFVDGSRFAKQLEKVKSAKSSLSGVVTDGALMSLQSYGIVADEDYAQVENTLQTSLRAAYKSIDDSAKDKAAAEKAKGLIDRAVKILLESLKQGSVETAVNVTADPSLNILASLTVGDGAKIEALAKDIAAESAKEKGPFKLEVNTGKYKDVNLHRATLDFPESAEEGVRKLFGDSLTISIGTSAKAVHISIGKTAEASLKAAVDRVAAKPSAKAEAGKMRLDLSQLLNVIQGVESNPVVDGMLAALSAGDDLILVDSQIVDRGSVVRITIQEGVLKGIAGGIKAGQAGQGGF